MIIYFDMDGVLAGLYDDPNWLAKLEASDASVYANARPLVHFSTLARYLNSLQACGYNIGIISWLSKNGTDKFNAEVAEVKRKWLAKHLPSVQWDEIHIIPYGVPKFTCSSCPNAILFDDESRNRLDWRGIAFGEDNLIEILKALLKAREV